MEGILTDLWASNEAMGQDKARENHKEIFQVIVLIFAAEGI